MQGFEKMNMRAEKAAVWGGALAQARPLGWALTRLSVQAYVVFCLFSVIGGGVTYPLATKLLLGDWRFWRYLRLAPRLYFFLWRSAWRMARGGGYGFMFSVPLFSPPASGPDLSAVRLKNGWAHGAACGDCTNCCDAIGCPLVDRDQTGCLGYDSAYWRYFNCGRFPISRQQLTYYDCPKWELRG